MRASAVLPSLRGVAQLGSALVLGASLRLYLFIKSKVGTQPLPGVLIVKPNPRTQAHTNGILGSRDLTRVYMSLVDYDDGRCRDDAPFRRISLSVICSIVLVSIPSRAATALRRTENISLRFGVDEMVSIPSRAATALRPHQQYLEALNLYG